MIGNDSFFRELTYTGRFFTAQEALEKGYVSYVTETKEDCLKKALEIANKIAEKSPVGIATIK